MFPPNEQHDRWDRNNEWYIFLFCQYGESLSETAIAASERRSNLLKQNNGATVSGIIFLSVKLNHADKAELDSGLAQHCSLIAYWYVHSYSVEKGFFTVVWNGQSDIWCYSKWAIKLHCLQVRTKMNINTETFFALCGSGVCSSSLSLH